eukprot:6059715-Amphidinium_carterae.1
MLYTHSRKCRDTAAAAVVAAAVVAAAAAAVVAAGEAAVVAASVFALQHLRPVAPCRGIWVIH